MALSLLTQLLKVNLISPSDEDFVGIQNVSKWWEDRIKQASDVRQSMKSLEGGYVQKYLPNSRARENLAAVFALRYEEGQNATNEATEYATADTIKHIIEGSMENATDDAREGAKNKEGAKHKKEWKWRRAQVSRNNTSLPHALRVSRLTAFQAVKAWPFWSDVKSRLSAMPDFDQGVVDATLNQGFVGNNKILREKFNGEWDELKKQQSSVGVDPPHPHGSDEEPPEKRPKLDTDTMDSGIGIEDTNGTEVSFPNENPIANFS